MIEVEAQTITSEVTYMRCPISIKRGMEMLASHSGLINISALLDLTNFKERFDTLGGVHCVDPKFSHSDILSSMIALISIGKPDYDAIEIFRSKQDFFTKALRIPSCQSAPTIRQRIDLIDQKGNASIKESVGDFIPLDIDVSPFDNSKTQKEGVSRTDKG
jgi:hypothetical protein